MLPKLPCNSIVIVRGCSRWVRGREVAADIVRAEWISRLRQLAGEESGLLRAELVELKEELARLEKSHVSFHASNQGTGNIYQSGRDMTIRGSDGSAHELRYGCVDAAGGCVVGGGRTMSAETRSSTRRRTETPPNCSLRARSSAYLANGCQ